MRLFLMLLFFLPLSVRASFLAQYGLNYSSQKDGSDTGEFEQSRTFNKAFLGASVNGEKTLYFGWNINSWSSSLSQGTASEDTYDMLEMGPRLQWFVNSNYNLYFTAEWNPYAKGEREKSSSSSDISGSGVGFGVGYRFRISRVLGFGAALHYQSLTLDEEKVGSTESEVTDNITNIMPMLEFTILTR